MPPKHLQTVRLPPAYPNSSPDNRSCNSLTPLRCPHAVHPSPSVDLGLVHQFEGDYVRFDQIPQLHGDSLVFEGSTVNGAIVIAGDGKLNVDIYYHPLAPLTRGQVANAFCLDLGLQVATLLAPPPPGFSYGNLGDFRKLNFRCSSPYDVSPDILGPRSYAEAKSQYRRVSIVPMTPEYASVKYVVADKWDAIRINFSVSADIGDILDSNGPGVYQVLMWGSIDGKTAVIADYPVFYEVTPPNGYN